MTPRHIDKSGRRRERWFVALAALVATYAFFYEYLPPFKSVRLWSDVAGYHYPLQSYAFHSLKEGRIPLWDPSVYCGISFVGNVQAALLYPPAWLLYTAVWTLPRIPFKAYEAFTFLHVWLGFVLCYLWLRARGGKLASALGALVFACGGYMVHQVLHPGVLGAMAWMPLALWGVDESVARSDWRPLWKVAAASALAFLAGYPAAWLVNCAILTVYALGSRGHWRAALRTAAALAASVPLFLAQLLPSLEARSTMALQAKYGVGAYGLGTLLRAYLVPNWFDFNPGHAADFEPGCLYLYLGLPALFAIAWALWRHRGRAYWQALLAMAAALLLANPPQFLIRAVEAIPALNYTLQPYNFYSAVAAMAALLAATALNDFLERRKPGSAPAWLWIGSAAALVGWSARQLWIWHAGGQFPTGARSVAQTAIGLVLFALCLLGVRQSTGRRRALLAGILLFGALADYQAFGSGRWFNAVKGDIDDEFPAYGIAGIDDAGYRAMLQNRQYRAVMADSFITDPASDRVWGLATTEGFDPFIPAQYRQAIQRWVPFYTHRSFRTDVLNEDMLRALGVRYVLARSGAEHLPALAASPNSRLVGRREIFCRVYEYVHAQPICRWEDAPDGTAATIAWTPERREIQARSQGGGRLVLVEQFFPGWHATVDGRPVAIERWGQAFQAIRLAAGEHRVTFEYRPASVPLGAGVDLAALIALLAVAWADRKAATGGPAPLS